MALFLCLALALPCAAERDVPLQAARVRIAGDGWLAGYVEVGGAWVRQDPRLSGVFHRVRPGTQGAGVLLRWPQFGSSYLFLPARRVQALRLGPRLPAAERERLRRAGAEAARKARARWAARRPRPPARPPAPLRPPRRQPEPPDPGLLLLQRFPPSQGWTPERRERIQWKMRVLDVFPGPEERAWLAVYDAWLAAYRRWQTERRKP